MLELEEALERILARVPEPTPERILLGDAHDRFAAEAVHAPINLPPFDNSAMDGYAVRSADVTGASAKKPSILRLTARVAAGEHREISMNAGECVRIFTGSPLPPGADAVIMQEDTRIDPHNPLHIHFLDSAKSRENVRFAGEDVKQNTTVVNAGERLTAGRLTLLAALGITGISAGSRPSVALLATGSELQAGGQVLRPGQIYESNRAALVPLILRAGGTPHVRPIVPDHPAATQAALEQAFRENDIVITCGGVSVGEMDFVKGAFEQMGGRMEFWKVAIKPGRPFVFGQLGNKLLFGLPGNPVSAFVTFLLLARPALLRWQGATDAAMAGVTGVLGEVMSNPGERRHFVRVRMDSQGAVQSAGVQASHTLSSLALANGLLDLKPRTLLREGTPVTVLRWD